MMEPDPEVVTLVVATLVAPVVVPLGADANGNRHLRYFGRSGCSQRTTGNDRADPILSCYAADLSRQIAAAHGEPKLSALSRGLYATSIRRAPNLVHVTPRSVDSSGMISSVVVEFGQIVGVAVVQRCTLKRNGRDIACDINGAECACSIRIVRSSGKTVTLVIFCITAITRYASSGRPTRGETL
jgi:hypothetical protein